MAVIGASQARPEDLERAEAVGRGLAQRGAVIVTGGGGGVMAAASKGATEAGGSAIGLLPGFDRAAANRWVTHALPTGLGELRNGLIIRAVEAVVAVGGAYGTLSEIALALHARRRVFGLHTWEIDGVEAMESPEAAVMAAFEAARGGRAQS